MIMDIQALVNLVSKTARLERHDDGQKTLGYLRDILSMLPSEMPCRFDTGENFGLEPVEYQVIPAYESDYFSDPANNSAHSATAFPSSFRGYYSDCTFNASKDYPESTVGHVLSLINGAIGRMFDGYKGGLNTFTEGTLVWGGDTSHSSTGNNAMVVGVEQIDGVCVLKTKEETWD